MTRTTPILEPRFVVTIDLDEDFVQVTAGTLIDFPAGTIRISTADAERLAKAIQEAWGE